MIPLSSRYIRLLLIGIAIVILGLAYAYFVEPGRLVIRNETIHISGWNPAFDGLRIAVIGDIHGGSNGADADKLRRVVTETNALTPDLIVLLGDYVSQKDDARTSRDLRMPMNEVAGNLSGMKALYGVFAVLGNHDGWYGDREVREQLEAVGIKVLENDAVTIDKNGQKLRVLGLPDHMKAQNWAWFSAEARAAVDRAGNDGDIVVLEHSPDILPMITGELSISPKLKLILAAHTHGGQVWLPVLGTPIVPSSYGQKYAYGHVRDRGVDLFVTSGIGTSILPFRFLVPPEIVILTVRSE